MDSQTYLSKLVVARTAHGDLVGVGLCVAYCDAPTLTLNTLDGSQIHTRADLCKVVPLSDDEAAFLVKTGC